MNQTQQTILRGEKYPYDETDYWNQHIEEPPQPAISWQHLAARGVIADLTDRHTIKRGFENVDEEIRKEIVGTLSDIIKEAHQMYHTNQ